VNKGHGRIEKRRVSICKAKGNYPEWPNLTTIIRVEYERQTKYELEHGIRYYISDLTASALEFGQRIRGYWGVENNMAQAERKCKYGLDRILNIFRMK
jgi:hypothetical protein